MRAADIFIRFVLAPIALGIGLPALFRMVRDDLREWRREGAQWRREGAQWRHPVTHVRGPVPGTHVYLIGKRGPERVLRMWDAATVERFAQGEQP